MENCKWVRKKSLFSGEYYSDPYCATDKDIKDAKKKVKIVMITSIVSLVLLVSLCLGCIFKKCILKKMNEKREMD